MPDDPDVPETAEPETASAPKTGRGRRAKSAKSTDDAEPEPKGSADEKKSSAKDGEKGESDEEVRAPRRAKLDDRTRGLLMVRRSLDQRRPIFGRQAANRYFRIGRDGAWRRPRGLQSKQRRHYGYRAKIVRVGYRSPARVRGLVPSGFEPVLVRNRADLEGVDAATQAAIIARTVGTRRRLVLEEEAQKLGIHVLNPIVKSEEV
jgi:large subunit ribosomal protein L32e